MKKNYLLFIMTIVLLFSCSAYASDVNKCHGNFQGVKGVSKPDLINLVDALGGIKGVKGFLKLTKTKFLKLTNLQSEKLNAYPHKKSKTKGVYWKKNKLGKRKTANILADDKVIAMKRKRFTLLDINFKIGTYPDRGGSAQFEWISIIAKHEGVSNLIEDYNIPRNIKGFSNGKDSLYLVDPATGESFEFKLCKK